VRAAASGAEVVSVGADGRAKQEQAILDARAKSNRGPMRLTWLTGRHRSTCWKTAGYGVLRIARHFKAL
jgi:hypothetical protein